MLIVGRYAPGSGERRRRVKKRGRNKKAELAKEAKPRTHVILLFPSLILSSVHPALLVRWCLALLLLYDAVMYSTVRHNMIACTFLVCQRTNAIIAIERNTYLRNYFFFFARETIQYEIIYIFFIRQTRQCFIFSFRFSLFQKISIYLRFISIHIYKYIFIK